MSRPFQLLVLQALNIQRSLLQSGALFSRKALRSREEEEEELEFVSNGHFGVMVSKDGSNCSLQL